jgi:hypothetical protein
MIRLAVVARLIALSSTLLAACLAQAQVTRVEVVSTEPFGHFKRGDFVKRELRVYGELSPEAESIRELDAAERNARGKAEYATRVTLVMPADPASANGTLLIDIPNRSRATLQPLMNSGRDVSLPLGAPVPGNGFLEEQGFTTAAIYWELSKDVQLPHTAASAATGGKPLYIEAAALPMVRDVLTFLTRATRDMAGTANPLNGYVRRTIIFGYSQSGRFAKTMLLTGHHMAEGAPLFSGMFIFGAASGQILLRNQPGPESTAGALPTFDNPGVRGVHEEPAVSVTDLVAQVRAHGDAVPKMLFVNTTTDYMSLRASLGRTGTGAADAALPANVRMYDVAGGSHARITAKSPCSLPFGRLDWHPVLRSTLLMLDRWVSNGAEPPPSELMPLADAGSDPLVLPAPPQMKGAVIKVPVRDRDGNPVGGIRVPDIDVPVGANAVQNPPLSFICSLGAGFSEFDKATLARRYGGRDDYVSKVRASATALEKRGFLLPEDARTIVESAAAVEIPAGQ